MPISLEQVGTVLNLQAAAYDSAGQQVTSDVQEVRVTPKLGVWVADFDFEQPENGQRIVEASPYLLSISSSLGAFPNLLPTTGIKYVEFFARQP